MLWDKAPYSGRNLNETMKKNHFLFTKFTITANTFFILFASYIFLNWTAAHILTEILPHSYFKTRVMKITSCYHFDIFDNEILTQVSALNVSEICSYCLKMAH